MRKLFCFIVTISILIVIINSNFANSDNDLNDTCELTQLSYEKNLTSKILNESTTEKEIIKEVMETFVTVSRAKVRNYDSYELEFLIKPSKLDDDNILYRLKTVEYESKYKKLIDRSIEWDDIEFINFSVEIKGSIAIASIVEIYQYYVKDDFDTVCKSIKEYTMTLENNNGDWKITNIKTNDAWETEDNFSYEDFDVEVELELKAKEIESWKIETKIVDFVLQKEAPVSSVKSSYSILSYSTSLAVEYAEEWFNGINPDFGNASADCQNFASQCVWAGFGGNEGSGAPHLTGTPVVYDSTYGSSNSRLWQHNNFYDGHNGVIDWHWDYVTGFSNYIDSSYYGIQGPFGAVVFNLNYANEGDVIDIDWDSTSPTLNTLNHAMFVTEVTGSFGSRNPDNIFIAAHNSTTNSAYMPLVDYTSSSESHFVTVRIFWGYY
jgi:hypothetical protein